MSENNSGRSTPTSKDKNNIEPSKPAKKFSTELGNINLKWDQAIENAAKKSSMTATMQNMRKQSLAVVQTLDIKSTTIGTKLEPFFTESKIQAFGFVYQELTIGFRIMWLFLGIILLAVVVYHCYFVVNDAINKEALSKISYPSLKQILQNNSHITAVKMSFCFKYGLGLDTAKLIKDNIRADQIDYFAWSLPLNIQSLTYQFESLDAGNKTSEDQDRLYKQYIEPLLPEKQNMQISDKERSAKLNAFFNQYRLSCDQLFVRCTNYNRTEVDCCQHFQPIINVDYGVCWESVRVPPVVAPGQFSQFRVELNYEVVDLFGIEKWMGSSFVDQDVNTTRDHKQNILVIISEDGMFEQAPWLYESFPLASEVTVSIAVSYLIDDSPKNCFKKANYLKYFRDYTVHNCMWERRFYDHPKSNLTDKCILPLFYLTNPRLNSTKQLPICNRDYLLQQHLAEPDDHIRSDLENMASIRPCLPSCERFLIAVNSLSTRTIGDQTTQAAILIYEKETYKLIKQNAALGWSDYLGLIGGTLGLWLGCSLVPFVYIPVTFTATCFERFRKKEN